MPIRCLLPRPGDAELCLLPALANRHGLITGATGTGKTVTLQVMAERFSRIGVPVFMADVKGDLSGISQPGAATPKFLERLTLLDVPEPAYAGCPTVFWDVFGEQGHPVRATISDLGPLLLSRVLNLNDTQAGVLALVFKVADDNGLLLLDLKDLRAMLQHVGDHAQEFQTNYGNVSAASIGAIQRGLLALEQQGAQRFIGEPMLNIDDLLQTGEGGHGVVNVLAADKLMNAPALYSTLLLWLLAELYEKLPEVGDPEKPKLVFFFDEAHLLFGDAPKALLDRIEQVVRLVRSKGVGGLLRHAEPARHSRDRAGPARQSRAARAARLHAARPESGQGGRGDDARQPENRQPEGDHRVGRRRSAGVVPRRERKAGNGRARVHPSTGRQNRACNGRGAAARDRWIRSLGHVRQADRSRVCVRAPQGTRGRGAAADTRRRPPAQGGSWTDAIKDSLGGLVSGSGRKDSIVEAVAKSAARTVGSTIGREIVRGVLGSLLGGRKR
jgi:hypothetical protein